MRLRLGIILAGLICGLHPACAATEDAFARGLEFSRAGQFPEAAAAFTKSATAQPAAGTLVNLGLAEWQRGHAGAAILAWEQARWIDPFETRAEANLKFARQVAQVDTPQLKWFETVSAWLPPNAWVWLAGATLWLTVGLMVLPGILRRRKTGWQPWLARQGAASRQLRAQAPRAPWASCHLRQSWSSAARCGAWRRCWPALEVEVENSRR